MEVYTFTEYNKKEKDLKDYRDKMMKVITDYVKFDVDFQKNHKINLLTFKNVFDLYKNQSGYYIMRYNNKMKYSSTDIEIFYGEYRDIEDYMRNPELYKISKISKKFNL